MKHLFVEFIVYHTVFSLLFHIYYENRVTLIVLSSYAPQMMKRYETLITFLCTKYWILLDASYKYKMKKPFLIFFYVGLLVVKVFR